MADLQDTSENKFKHIPKAIVGAAAEGVCDTLTSPVTIIKGLVHGSLRETFGGVIDATEGVEIVGSPGTYFGRKAWGETGGKFLNEKIHSWAENHGINIPQVDNGRNCLKEVFSHADAHKGEIALDNVDAKFLRSPQVRSAIENNKVGLF